MIERLLLKNYRSIAEADVVMRPLNILIGPNGAGKSNFLSFFRLLRDGANGKLQEAINGNDLGGFPQLRHYGASSSGTIDWTLTFQPNDSTDKLYYSGKLASRGVNGYSVRLEELERDPYPGYENRFKYLNVSDGRVRILKVSETEDEPPYDESDQELLIAQVRNRIRYPVLSEVRQYIADWQIFRGFGTDALEAIRTAQIFDLVEPFRLAPSGQNLVSILQALANQPQYEVVYNDLQEILQSVFDDLVKLDTPVVAGSRGTLNYRSRHFKTAIPASAMSDGQLRFLGLVLLLLLPNPPSLITIDEPEIGLHPEMLSILAELMQQAAEHTQLIVTTHSPQLIDAAQPEDILVVQREEGRTTLERLDTDGLNQWLERYTLGKLWTMGKLEAR